MGTVSKNEGCGSVLLHDCYFGKLHPAARLIGILLVARCAGLPGRSFGRDLVKSVPRNTHLHALHPSILTLDLDPQHRPPSWGCSEAYQRYLPKCGYNTCMSRNI